MGYCGTEIKITKHFFLILQIPCKFLANEKQNLHDELCLIDP